MYLVSCLVIFVLLIFVGLVNKNELIGLFLLVRLEWDKWIVDVSVLIDWFWLNISIFKLWLRFFSVFLLFDEIFCCGIWVILDIINLIFVILMVFLCFDVGCKCWFVLVLLMILIVLLGKWCLLMYFVFNLVVVLSVFCV